MLQYKLLSEQTCFWAPLAFDFRRCQEWSLFNLVTVTYSAPFLQKPGPGQEEDGCCFASWMRRSLGRKGTPLLPASSQGARVPEGFSGALRAHGTLQVLPWESTQWGRKGDFQTSRPPKWELVSFKGPTRFTCTNPVSELGLLASPEDKRTPQRQRRQEKFLFASPPSFLSCSELSTIQSSCF